MKSQSYRWSDGSRIEIYGINGNLAFKGLMDQDYVQDHPFSLYTPIGHDVDWKVTFISSPSWNQYSFNDASWTILTTASANITASTTTYLRRPFAGIPNMAAIDLQFKYQFGIVAYINGREVFRDNIPDGIITSATRSTHSYSQSDYHGIICPAFVAENEESVLAVELHFPDDSQRITPFNALLAFLAGISSTNPCFIAYGYSGFDSLHVSPTTLTDMIVTRGRSIESFPDYISMQWEGQSMPMVNSIRFYDDCPYFFTLEGFDVMDDRSSLLFSSDYSLWNHDYWYQMDSVLSSHAYKYMKITFHKSWIYELTLCQMQFLVCNRHPQTIEYPHSHYSFIKSYESVTIAPTLLGFTNCSISPPLPSGLILSPDTCIISGIPTEVVTEKEHRVLGVYEEQDVEGTITISVRECSGSVYKIGAEFPASTRMLIIRDAESNGILYTILIDKCYSTAHWVQYVCISADTFKFKIYDYYSMPWRLYSILPNGEEEVVIDYWRKDLPNNIVYNPSIPHSSQWFYHMGDVPENWFHSNTSGWSHSSRGLYPNSTNRIQLYKRSFSISSLNRVMELVLSIRYRYGCVVYLNGREAWRNGVDGEIATSVVTNSYDSLIYRVVTLPGRTMSINGSTPIQFISNGTNTIAIAIIAPSDNFTESLFDATLRLVDTTPLTRMWEYTGLFKSSSYYDGNQFVDMGVGFPFFSSTDHSHNSISIKLNKDRREWINTIEFYNRKDTVTQFKFYGRNEGEWVLLKDVSGLIYSYASTIKRIYLNTSIPYNEYKLENLGNGNPEYSEWRIKYLHLYVTITVTELLYPANVTILKNTVIETIDPQGEGYVDFQINPPLPAGLDFDPQRGCIAGTATMTSPATLYQITATSVIGDVVIKTMIITVTACEGDRSFVYFRFYTDDYSTENSWKLFAGRGTNGTLIDSVNQFPFSRGYYYVDHCLENGIYTLQSFDSYGDGWHSYSGFTLIMDNGEMELEIEKLRDGPPPVSVTTVFSSYLPFQIEYTEWKVNQGESVAEDWNTVSYDDSAWTTMKAAAIPDATSTTIYIRKSFQLTNVNEYSVMNIRLKYTGGVVVYFNGNRVARFNLVESFDASTESIALHDAETFSKFHIILSTAGVQEGTNVIAFELHRPVGVSSPYIVVFDATGVFGVNDCSTVVDSYASLTSTLTTPISPT